MLVKAFPAASVSGFTNLFSPPEISGVPGADAWVVFIEALRALVLVNLILATLNLLPIPPLDGFHILRTVLPEDLGRRMLRASGAGMIFLILLLYTDTIRYVFIPAVIAADFLGSLPGQILHLP
jgi:Zn-dependent protease